MGSWTNYYCLFPDNAPLFLLKAKRGLASSTILASDQTRTDVHVVHRFGDGCAEYRALALRLHSLRCRYARRVRASDQKGGYDNKQRRCMPMRWNTVKSWMSLKLALNRYRGHGLRSPNIEISCGPALTRRSDEEIVIGPRWKWPTGRPVAHQIPGIKKGSNFRLNARIILHDQGNIAAQSWCQSLCQQIGRVSASVMLV